MVEFGESPERHSELEAALCAALRPLPAPEGFADRVLARAQISVKSRSVAVREHFRFHPPLRWAAAAVLLLVVSLGAFWAGQRQRRIEGERARQQILLALRITGTTIRAVRVEVAADNHNHGSQQETP